MMYLPVDNYKSIIFYALKSYTSYSGLQSKYYEKDGRP